MPGRQLRASRNDAPSDTAGWTPGETQAEAKDARRPGDAEARRSASTHGNSRIRRRARAPHRPFAARAHRSEAESAVGTLPFHGLPQLQEHSACLSLSPGARQAPGEDEKGLGLLRQRSRDSSQMVQDQISSLAFGHPAGIRARIGCLLSFYGFVTLSTTLCLLHDLLLLPGRAWLYTIRNIDMKRGLVLLVGIVIILGAWGFY